MFQTFRNAWKIPELKNRLLFTLAILVVYRLGCAIPVPFVSGSALTQMFANGDMLSYLNMMSGGALARCTLFALGVTPYINASIIVQLLTVAIPALENLAKEADGQQKLQQINRYAGAVIALIMGIGYYFVIRNMNALEYRDGAAGIFAAVVIIATFVAGAQLITWCGEQIDDKGIGNGISIILFAGIVSRIPALITQLFGGSGTGSYWSRGGVYYFLSPFVCVILILMVAFIVWMDNAERRIPVQYAKRVVGRKMYGGQNTHIPIKVNMSGVMPIIFAGSILSIPPTIQMFIPSAKLADSKFWTGFFKVFTSTHWAYGIIYFILIIAFAYFYSSIQYNPIEMSQNIAKNGGMIPGIRTGRPTSDYIARIISRITLLGALLLSVVAIFPIVFSQLTTLILTKTTVYADGMNVSLGGTSIIILVGVALETVKQLESQMMMRHYKGFLD